MDIEEIEQKIKENEQKFDLLKQETDRLVAEKLAIKNKQKIDQFQIGMVVYDSQYDRIGKITEFKTFLSNIGLGCEGFDCIMDNSNDHSFEIDLGRVVVLSMSQTDYLNFKENINSRKRRYEVARRHALNIEDSCKNFYRNQIRLFSVK